MPLSGLAQDIPTELPSPEYVQGKVIEIIDEGTTTDDFSGIDLPYQEVKVAVDNGPVTVINYGGIVAISPQQLVQVGSRVVLVKNDGALGEKYSIVDIYRLPNVLWLLIIFAVLVVALARWRGLGALVGVGVSLIVLVQWLVPTLLTTQYQLLVTVVTLSLLAAVNFYLGHGFKKTTSLALVCTLGCFMLAIGVAWVSTHLLQLSGGGSEEALSLKYGFAQNIDLSGLLLAGLLLGAIGILDDVTTAQVTAVSELQKANPELSTKALFMRGYEIGREHIVALVNTLVLVYAGAALPAFLILTNFSTQPLWVSLNSETLLEGIVQILVGSITLVLAVPITTWVAAWWFGRDVIA